MNQILTPFFVTLTLFLCNRITTGAVSVQQQLRIIERMCRSYPFLKVISTGHLFQFNPLTKP